MDQDSILISPSPTTTPEQTMQPASRAPATVPEERTDQTLSPPATLKKNGRTSRFVVGGIAVIVIAAGAAIFLNSGFPRNISASGSSVRRGDLAATVNATAKVRSKKAARLSLPISGIVASIEKLEGDPVNEGDVILSLRAEETARRAKQAEINLQNRQLELARAKGAPRSEDLDISRASLRKATVSVALAEAVFDAAASSQNAATREIARADLDIARANFNRLINGVTKEEIDALQNSVQIAQIELDGAKAALANTKLAAPFTGNITEINVRENELIGAYNPLASLAQINALELATEIDEIDVANVDVGQNVEIRFDAFPGERFAGTITRLFPAASTQRGSTVYGAVVDFDGRDFKIRPGMGASMKIKTVEKKGVLLVPNRALKNVGTRKSVRVLSPGGPRDVIVVAGATDGNETEVLSGVNEGDVVSIQ